jgi:hypothetical protein
MVHVLREIDLVAGEFPRPSILVGDIITTRLAALLQASSDIHLERCGDSPLLVHLTVLRVVLPK